MAGSELMVLVVSTEDAYAERVKAVLAARNPGRLRAVACTDAGDVLVESAEQRIDAVIVAIPAADRIGLASVERVCVLLPETAVIVVMPEESEQTARRLVRGGAQDVMLADRLEEPDVLARIHSAVERQSLTVEQTTRRHHLEVANHRFRTLISDRFRSLVMDNADAMLVLDKGGRTCFINPAAERLLHQQSGELITSQFGLPRMTDEETEIEIPRPDGSALVAAMRIMETVWEGEDAYIISLRDVTERKRLERAMRAAKQTAERASRMKSMFLANMSHELRTPLNAIIGFAEIMKGETFGPLGHAKYKDYARHITESGAHLLELINGLLDLSKAESGKLELVEEEFDLAKLLADMANVMQGRADAGKVALATAMERPLPVRADRLKMRQIALNLLSNAIKFTPEGGEVRLSARMGKDSRVVIKVADTGIGIPPDQIPRAFAAFTQVANPWTKKPAEGSGLGLALTKRLVELHGGSIKLNSGVGTGTTATIMLPAERSAGAHADRPARRSPAREASAG